MLGSLGKELGIQQHLLPQTWDREEASQGHSGRWGWVDSSLFPSPSLGEAGCHFEVNTRGRLPWQRAAWQSLSL